MIVGVTMAQLKHSGKIPDARDELSASVREEYGIDFLLGAWMGLDQGHMT